MTRFVVFFCLFFVLTASGQDPFEVRLESHIFLQCPQATDEMFYAKCEPHNDTAVQAVNKTFSDNSTFKVTRSGWFGCRPQNCSACWTRKFNVKKMNACVIQKDIYKHIRDVINLNEATSCRRNYSQMNIVSGLSCSWRKENEDCEKQVSCGNPSLEFEQFSKPDEGTYFLISRLPGVYEGVQAVVNLTMEHSRPYDPGQCECGPTPENNGTLMCKIWLACILTTKVRISMTSDDSPPKEWEEDLQIEQNYTNRIRSLVFWTTPSSRIQDTRINVREIGCLSPQRLPQICSLKSNLPSTGVPVIRKLLPLLIVGLVIFFILVVASAASQNALPVILFGIRALNWRCHSFRKKEQPTICIFHLPRDKCLAVRLKDRLNTFRPAYRCYAFYDPPDNIFAGEDAFSGRNKRLQEADLYVILSNSRKEWPVDVCEGIYHCRKHLYRSPCIVAPVNNTTVTSPIQSPICCWMPSGKLTILEWQNSEEETLNAITYAIDNKVQRYLMHTITV